VRLRGVVAAVGASFTLAACGQLQSSLPLAGPSPSPECTRHRNICLRDDDAKKPRFDGTIHGWRVATFEVIKREGLNRDLSEQMQEIDPDCEWQRFGEETHTSIDFVLTYFPSGVKVVGQPGVEKWACGDIGGSMFENYSFDETPHHLGTGSLFVQRSLQNTRAFAVHTAEDRVEACAVRGLPAICVHALDDATGLGDSKVFVIEDDKLDPFVTVLLVEASEIPFEETLKVAEGVR
jgi:hypothetical protein